MKRCSAFAAVSVQILWRLVAYGAALLAAAQAARGDDAGMNSAGAGTTAGAVKAATTAAASHSLTAAYESIQSGDLKKHAAYLADDTFEGREAGSRGGRAAGGYLGEELRRNALAGGGTGGGYYQTFGQGYRNVLGLIEGSDLRLKDEVIVVSAHYDHVGYGAPNNSRGKIGYIHNGADDNASGTAGLLEVIEAFAQLEPRPKRTLLFAFWDGEEKGLLGSKHWVGQPTLPLERVRAMVNLDMIGRLHEQKVEVSGVRTAAGWPERITRDNRGLDLRLTFTWEIKANSDHHPFFARGIPFLMLHTGLHADYHKPSDDADKLNIEGIQAIARLCFRLVSELADRPSLPAFRTASRTETLAAQQAIEQPSPPLPPRLGISWPPRTKDEVGLVVSDVALGSAAARAGIRSADRILRFDDQELRDDGEFQSHMLTVEKTIRLTLERSGEKKPLDVKVDLDGEPVRIGIAWRVDDAEPGTVILTRVVPASPAARAGLQAGDRIYAVGGRRFDTKGGEFLQLLGASANPGARDASARSSMELEFAHEGEIRKAVLEVTPVPSRRASEVPPSREPGSPARE